MISQMMQALGSATAFAVVMAMAFGIALTMGLVLAYFDSQHEGKW